MKNNKGFSLVELIIVVAIMAVLMGVLAPQYLRYVEKTKIRTDDGIVSDIDDSIEAILSDAAGDKYGFNTDNKLIFTVSYNGSISVASGCTFDNSLLLELYATVYGDSAAPTSTPFGSNAYKAVGATGTVATITYEYNATYATFKSTITSTVVGSSFSS